MIYLCDPIYIKSMNCFIKMSSIIGRQIYVLSVHIGKRFKWKSQIMLKSRLKTTIKSCDFQWVCAHFFRKTFPEWWKPSTIKKVAELNFLDGREISLWIEKRAPQKTGSKWTKSNRAHSNSKRHKKYKKIWRINYKRIQFRWFFSGYT